MAKDKPWLRETCWSRTAHREALMTQSSWMGAVTRGDASGDGLIGTEYLGDGGELAREIEVALI